MSKERCLMCNKKVKMSKAIVLPKGDLDLHGIWMGDLGKHVWFDGQVFCTFKCLVCWLKAARRQIRESSDDHWYTDLANSREEP